MREIKEIIVHCADTRTDQSFSVEDVKKWHVEDNGWSDVGYHFYIRLDGTIEKGRDLDKVGAHTGGFNKNTIGICFEGGKKPNGEQWDNATYLQMDAFRRLKVSLFIILGKELEINGHYKYSQKTCPNFDVDILR
jgi:N-acetylmuramoyl-L-alanine amidase